VSETSADAQACRDCCGAIAGRHRASCEQETKLALPTAREFLPEAAGRYVALDGRLWRALFALLTRPGFLTREYFSGRRRRYIGPARLFLVLSLTLFALLRIVADAPMIMTSEPAKDASALTSRLMPVTSVASRGSTRRSCCSAHSPSASPR
jgi:Protein of unknown function (DUF3667)